MPEETNTHEVAPQDMPAPAESSTSQTNQESVTVKDESTISHAPDIPDKEDSFQKLLKMVLPDDEFRNRCQKFMDRAKSSMGLRALEDSRTWDKNNLVEKTLHYMMFEPDYFFQCNIEEVHSMEASIAAAIAFVKHKQNIWTIQYDAAKIDFERTKKVVASQCSGKSVGEREANALVAFPDLKKMERKLILLKIFRDSCDGMPESFDKIDMSLKKILARREYKIYNKQEKGENQW